MISSPHGDPVRGVLFSLACGLCYGTASALVAEGAGHIPGGQFLAVRGLLGLVLLTPWTWKTIPTLFAKSSGVLWVRAVAGAVAVVGFYYTLQISTVGTASALALTTHVLVLLFSWRFLRERIARKDVAAIAVVLAGAALLYFPGTTRPTPIVTVAGLAGALSGAIAIVALRRAVRRYSSASILWALSLVTLLTGLLIGVGNWASLTRSVAALLLAVGSVAFLSQVTLTHAMRHLPASIVLSLAMSALPLGVWISILLGHRAPTAWEWLAYAVMLGGIVMLKLMHAAGSAAGTIVGDRVQKVRAVGALRNRDLRRMLAAVAEAERHTSCEFRIHLDRSFRGDFVARSNEVADEIGMGNTKLANGVLIYGALEQEAWRIWMAPGIRDSSIREQADELEAALGGATPDAIVRSVQVSLHGLASCLGVPFPISTRDVNELEDWISVSDLGL